MNICNVKGERRKRWYKGKERSIEEKERRIEKYVAESLQIISTKTQQRYYWRSRLPMVSQMFEAASGQMEWIWAWNAVFVKIYPHLQTLKFSKKMLVGTPIVWRNGSRVSIAATGSIATRAEAATLRSLYKGVNLTEISVSNRKVRYNSRTRHTFVDLRHLQRRKFVLDLS